MATFLAPRGSSQRPVTVITLAELFVGPHRYRELERAPDGISQRMTTLTACG